MREEKKEGRQLRADHIDSLEMVVTLLPAGCCCSEKEETLDPPKIAHRCNGLPEASHRHVLKTHPGSSPTPVSPEGGLAAGRRRLLLSESFLVEKELRP